MAHNDDTAKGTIEIKFQMDRQRMRDIMTTAFEQGSCYWMGDDDFHMAHAARDEQGYVKSISLIHAVGATIPKFRDRLGREATVNDQDIADAIGRMLAHPDVDGAWAAGAELKGDYDAATADNIVQFAFFGELVYG